MSVNELIELLEDHRDEFSGDAEVRLMTQQNWPFENSIRGVVSGEAILEHGEEGDDADPDDEEDAEKSVCFIVEGGQLGYGSKAAWDCC